MNKSGELRKRLAGLVEKRNEFRYNRSEPLGQQVVIALLGASGVGKSTIGKRMQEIAPEFGITDIAEVGTEASRPSRPDDPGNYNTGVPREVMMDRIEKGAYVNWSPVINTVTGDFDIYATPPEGFATECTVMPCLPESLPMLRRAGFKAVHAFYIVTDADSWENQLEERMYTAETMHLPVGQRAYRADFGRRMDEAMVSIPFGLSSKEVSQIVSLPGDEELTETARKILEWSTDGSRLTTWGSTSPSTFSDDGFDLYGRDMFQVALRLAQQFEEVA